MKAYRNSGRCLAETKQIIKSEKYCQKKKMVVNFYATW